VPTPESISPIDRRRRRIRWWIGCAVVLAAAAVAWHAVERAVDLEQYHRALEAELSRVTGLPVAIGRLDLALRPIPCVSVIDLEIGSGDFRLVSSRVDVYPAFHALLSRHLDILGLGFDELVLTIPPTVESAQRALRETWSHANEALETNEPSGGALGFIETVEVHTIGADDVRLRLGADSPDVLLASLKLRGLTSDQLELSLDAAIPDSAARADGTLMVPLDRSWPSGIRGRLDLRELRPQRFFDLPRLLHAQWRARVDVTAPTPDSVRVDVEGEFAGEEQGALGGTVTGRAQFPGETPPTAEFDVTGDGLNLHAAAKISDETTLRIDRFVASGASLARMLALLESRNAKAFSKPGATLTARNLAFAFGRDAIPRLVDGEIEMRGLGFEWNGHVLADDLRLDGSLAEGALVVNDLRGGPLALHGTLTPGPAWDHLDLALAGTLGLEDTWVQALAGTDSLRAASGTLRIETLTGRLPPAPEAASLTIGAHLSDGSIRIVTADVDESVSDIALDVSSRESRVYVEGRARSPGIGALELSTTLDPARPAARGSLTADAGSFSRFVADPDLRSEVTPLLRAYGWSRMEFDVGPSDVAGEVATLRLDRVEAPRITARIGLRDDPEERLGDVEMTAVVPADGLAGWLPEAVQATGAARIDLRHSTADRSFDLDADLTDLGVATGRLIEKQPGEVLKVRVDGSTRADGWEPRRLDAKGAEGSLSVGLEAGGIVAPDLDVDLSQWDFLLVDTARASGRIRGAISTPARSATLVLADVAFQLSPDVGVDAIDGGIEIDGDDWNLREIRIRGAQSEALLSAVRTGDRLDGRLEGAGLDVDLFRALYGEIDALRPEAPPAPESSHVSGAFAIRLDRVGYGRSEARDLRATIALEDGDASVDDLAFETYEGRVAGKIAIDTRDAQPPLLSVDLDISDVSGRFLDDMFADEPRGVRGRFNGKLAIAAPVRDDWKSMLASADGFLTATARDGSFGRIRIATKILTVLRATETFRLKPLAWKDDGLVFDTTDAEVALDQGRLTLDRFELDSTSYRMTASGHIDFRKQESRVPIEVNVTQGLTGVLGRLPVAHAVLEIAKVRMVATGSPYDLKVGMASMKDQLVGAGTAAPKAAIKRIGDALRRPRVPGADAAVTPSEVVGTPPESDRPEPEAAAAPDSESVEPETPDSAPSEPAADPTDDAEG